MKTLPPSPPPMRRPNASINLGSGPSWVVLVFIVGLAVGSKMVGGW